MHDSIYLGSISVDINNKYSVLDNIIVIFLYISNSANDRKLFFSKPVTILDVSRKLQNRKNFDAMKIKYVSKLHITLLKLSS